MNSKKYFFGVLFGTLILLVVFAIPTIMVDPYFHYGPPKGTYELTAGYQRYHNDGILRYFEYDALITGSSMVENFKTTEFDRLFGTNSIKTPFSGAYFKEIDDAVNTALNANDNVMIVVRSLDLDILDQEKDSARYESYPDYLYDNNLFNDVRYFLNKKILLQSTKSTIEWRRNKKESTTFDEYSSFGVDVSLDKLIDMKDYIVNPIPKYSKEFTEVDRFRVFENINQNVSTTAMNNPDITFYLFFPPYSRLYFDEKIADGSWNYYIDVQKCAIEELLEYENIKLYSFCNDYEVVCNLKNYRDITHYNSEISSQLLQKMKAGEKLLSKDNYLEYLEEIKNYYLELHKNTIQ